MNTRGEQKKSNVNLARSHQVTVLFGWRNSATGRIFLFPSPLSRGWTNKKSTPPLVRCPYGTDQIRKSQQCDRSPYDILVLSSAEPQRSLSGGATENRVDASNISSSFNRRPFNTAYSPGPFSGSFSRVRTASLNDSGEEWA